MMPTSAIWQIYGFGVGAILSALLAAVAYRSPGAGRWGRLCFAACALLVNAACIAKHIVILAGIPPGSGLVRKIWAIGFLAAAFWPVGILTAWREQAEAGHRRIAGRWLLVLSVACAIWISAGAIAAAWVPALCSRVSILRPFLDREFILDLTLVIGLLMSVLGAFLLLPGRLERRRDRAAVAMMIGGLLFASASALTYRAIDPANPWSHILQVCRLQFVGFTVLGGLLYFSQFRSADIFAKRALQVLLVASIAVGATALIWGPGRIVAGRTADPTGALLLFTAVIASLGMVLRSRASGVVDLFIERWIFGAQDVPQLLRQFREHVGQLEGEEQILEAARTAIQKTLGIQLIAFPLDSHDDIGHLVTAEVEVLRQIAACCGARLDELKREEEHVARVRRESQLAQQLIQAELRALRAQVNPHFLFNSLNTIASLIVSDPKKAESMTVRLAHTFRYVLTHADRPLASLEEEMNFLRTYLSIEQVRFGQRLAVEFDLDPAVSGAVLPSLILQPLVENAIKHGIAPKVGRSTLVIRARRDRTKLLLSVLDDGVGLRANRPSLPENSSGVGLNNIRERLQTMYGHEAHLSLQAVSGGGSIAAIELPLSE
jgi:two-component system LytT family sensor kinase